jgi:endonuclease YncB( thermonuclease family)
MSSLALIWLTFTLSAWSGPTSMTGTVVKVYDGDTVVMDNDDRVRVRWINTPEKRPAQAYADEAQRFAERLLLNRKVVLHLDPTHQRDGYGRLVAAIQVGSVDLSLALVERGLAHVFIIPPEPDDIRPLLAAQAKAKKARRGIWSNRRYQGDLHITSFHGNAPGDDRQNVNGEYLRICNIADAAIDLGTFSMRNSKGKRWRLPAVEIPAGHTVRLHSGVGVAQTDPAQQLTAHLNSREPIWSNEGDRATLTDANGRLVDEQSFGKVR